MARNFIRPSKIPPGVRLRAKQVDIYLMSDHNQNSINAESLRK